jgi:pimeloyl-ACP methyl ester carboxylesterase
VATLPEPINVIFINGNFEKMNLQKKLTFAFIRAKLKLLTLINKRKAAAVAFKLFCTPFNTEPVKESPVFKNAEKLKFDLEGKKISGFRFNNPKTNKVLILHGFSSNIQKFEKIILPLIDKQFEVLAFDAPAHGNSEGKTINVLEYKAMIKMINTQFGPVNNYITHSFGGMATCLAIEEVKDSSNTKLVLIAPLTETSTAIENAFAIIGISNASPLRKCIDDIILEISGKPTAWFSIRRALKNINASILWVQDEDDNITPLKEAIKVKEDNLPNVNFIITKTLGHNKIYKDDSVIKAVIDFL